MSTACVFNCLVKSKKVVNSIGEHPQNPDGSIKGAESDAIHDQVKRGVVETVALAGVGATALTMAVTTGTLVDVASVCSFGMLPLVAIQKRRIKSMGGMRGQTNELRHSVNRISEENNVLHSSLSGLELEVTKLEEVENNLGKIAVTANTNVTRLKNIVVETNAIQTKIKTILRQDILMDILSIVIHADKDENGEIGENELNHMILRLHHRPGFEFLEQNFHNLIKQHQKKQNEPGIMNFNTIMSVIRNLMDDKVSEGECIFKMKTEQLMDTDSKMHE